MLQIVMFLNLYPYFYRRTALQMWKRKSGPEATYKNLIDLFEQAQYKDYAETVRSVFFNCELRLAS